MTSIKNALEKRNKTLIIILSLLFISVNFIGCKKENNDSELQPEYYFYFERNGELVEYEYFSGKYRGQDIGYTYITASNTNVDTIHAAYGSFDYEGVFILNLKEMMLVYMEIKQTPLLSI